MAIGVDAWLLPKSVLRCDFEDKTSDDEVLCHEDL